MTSKANIARLILSPVPRWLRGLRVVSGALAPSTRFRLTSGAGSVRRVPFGLRVVSGALAPSTRFRLTSGAGSVQRVPRGLRVVSGALAASAMLFPVPVTGSAPRDSLPEEPPYHIEGDNLRAWVDRGERVWDLTGHVRVTHDSTVATAKHGRYWEDTETLSLSDSVVVVDGDMVLRTEAALYREDRVDAWEGVELEEGNARLTGDRGTYFMEEKRTFIVGRVKYDERPWWVSADSLEYDREQEIFHAVGRVKLKDRDAKVEADGPHLFFDRETREGRMTDGPVLYLWSDEKREPVQVNGSRMDFFADGGTACVVGNVVIIRDEMTARCDSAVFFNREDRAVLYGDPVVEEGKRRITGTEMEIVTREGQIKRLLVAGEARAGWAHEGLTPQGEPKTSVLLGQRIRFFFEDEELTTIVVVGEARSSFYPERSRRADERNTVAGERITLTVEDEKFNRILVEGNAVGEYVYSNEAEVAPGDSLTYERVDYSAQEIEYLTEEDLINMDREAEVEYGPTRLNAGRIEFDVENEWMLATRSPVLWEQQSRMDGDRMTYNLETERGTIAWGKTKYDKGYYTGRRIRKVGENELNADWGVYTSCDDDEPHYSFRARRMKLYLKDKVVAKPLILYIRDIPVLALPFYVFPIKPGRHSGLLVPNIEPGISKDKGRFVKNLGYYWAINDYSDLALWGDYYETTQWTGHFRGRYNVRYLLNGNAEGSYTSYPQVGGTKTKRWDLRASHNQSVTDQLALTARADFVSDETYRIEANDIDQSYLDRINRELKSSLSLNQRWSDRSLALAVDRRQYLNINETDTVDNTRVSQTLPQLSFKVFRRRLSEPLPGKEDEARWYQTLYYDVSSNVSRKETLKEYGKSVNQSANASFSLSSQKILGSPSIRLSSKVVDAQDVGFSLDRSLDSTSGDWVITPEKTKDEERWASLSTVTLNGSPKLMSWLDVRPSFKYEMTLFDHDRLGNRWAKLHTWNTSLGLASSIYGTFMPRWGKLEGVRHVVNPSVSWSYRPEFDEYDRNDYDSIGGIGAPTLTGTSYLNLSLSNMFHLKLRDGEEVRKMDNVVQLRSSTSYDLRYKESNKDHPWSNLTSSLIIQPARAFDFRVNTTHDLDRLRVLSRSFTSSLKLTGQGFRIGTGSGRPESVMEKDALRETEEHLEDAVGAEERSHRRDLTASAPLEPWTASFSYRYSKSNLTAEPTQWLNADLSAELTHNWKLVYGNRYDLVEKETAYQSFTLYRDLHCWEMRISGEYSNEDWTYYFKINIKAHPELYIERGARRIGGGAGRGYY